MCALIGAVTKSDFEQIHLVNRYRGEVSHSVARFLFDERGQANLAMLVQGKGKYDPQYVQDVAPNDGLFSMFIGHTQAPTTESSDVHPAFYQGARLWHNGIVKQGEVDGWDTMMILQTVYHENFSALSKIDGTFACFLHLDEKLYVFRNEISPLFYDWQNLRFSSTKMEGMHPLPANQVFAIEPNGKGRFLRYVAEFKTKENPYFFME